LDNGDAVARISILPLAASFLADPIFPYYREAIPMVYQHLKILFFKYPFPLIIQISRKKTYRGFFLKSRQGLRAKDQC
jgi:hypothetical protein